MYLIDFQTIHNTTQMEYTQSLGPSSRSPYAFSEVYHHSLF